MYAYRTIGGVGLYVVFLGVKVCHTTRQRCSFPSSLFIGAYWLLCGPCYSRHKQRQHGRPPSLLGPVVRTSYSTKCTCRHTVGLALVKRRAWQSTSPSDWFTATTNHWWSYLIQSIVQILKRWLTPETDHRRDTGLVKSPSFCRQQFIVCCIQAHVSELYLSSWSKEHKIHVRKLFCSLLCQYAIL